MSHQDDLHFHAVPTRADRRREPGDVGDVATDGTSLAERLLTLTLRHRDVERPDALLDAIAIDLGRELAARVTVRGLGEEPLHPDDGITTSVRVLVRDELVAFLDLTRPTPLGEEERRLLIAVARLLDDRLSQLARRDETRLQFDLTRTVSPADGLRSVATRAIDMLLTHTGAVAGTLLLCRNDAFEVLAEAGTLASGDDDAGESLSLARASLTIGDPLVERDGWVACLLGHERPHRYVLVLRFPRAMRLRSLRWPALRQAARTLAPHVESLWREEVRARLLEFHGGSWDHSTTELYARLLDAAIRLVHGADSGSLLVRRNRDEPFVFHAVKGFDSAALQGVSVGVEEMHAWYGADEADWRRGRPRLVHTGEVDIADLSRTSTPQIEVVGSGTDRIEATLCLPVLHEGEVMAVLNLDNQHDPGAFGRDSHAIIDDFGPPLAGILHRQHTQDLLNKAAQTDPLTGLYNRRPFSVALQRELARHHRTGTPLSVLMLDLSDFKAVNDELGHDAGDHALVRVAGALRQYVRSADVLSRRGGDEFAMILVDTPADMAAVAADRLRDAVARIMVGGRALAINVGCASAPEDGANERELVALADRRMYAGKRRRQARNAPARREP